MNDILSISARELIELRYEEGFEDGFTEAMEEFNRKAILKNIPAELIQEISAEGRG